MAEEHCAKYGRVPRASGGVVTGHHYPRIVEAGERFFEFGKSFAALVPKLRFGETFRQDFVRDEKGTDQDVRNTPYDSADSGNGRHGDCGGFGSCGNRRSEEHTSELQSLMRISYAVFCLK